MNDPIGLPLSLSPATDLSIVSATTFTASSCPLTLSLILSSRCNIFSFLVSVNFDTGIPVHLETMSAISSAVTSCFNKEFSFVPISALFCCSCNSFSRVASLPYFNSANLFKSYSLSAFSISSLTFSISFLIFLTFKISSFSSSHLEVTIFFSSLVSASSFSKTFNLSFEASSVSFCRALISISICKAFLVNLSNSSGIESISVLIIAAASSIKSIALSGNFLSLIYLWLRVAASTIAASAILTP